MTKSYNLEVTHRLLSEVVRRRVRDLLPRASENELCEFRARAYARSKSLSADREGELR